MENEEFLFEFPFWQTRWGCKTPVSMREIDPCAWISKISLVNPPPTKTWHMISKLQGKCPLKLGHHPPLPTRHCKNIGIKTMNLKILRFECFTIGKKCFQIWDVFFLLQEARQSFGKQHLHVLKSGSAYTCTSLSCGNWRSISLRQDWRKWLARSVFQDHWDARMRAAKRFCQALCDFHEASDD